MKCYIHPDREAVGVCTICKRGVCRSCEVILDGRHYCKVHAEKRLVREERAAGLHQRGTAITLASILAILGGLSGFVVGFLLILIGLLGPTSQNSPILFSMLSWFLTYFQAVTAYPPGQTVLVGLGAFLFGSVGMVAGYFLWRRSKRSAILAAVMGFLGEILVAASPEVAALAGAFTYAWVVATIVSIFLIAYGWKRLK